MFSFCAYLLFTVQLNNKYIYSGDFNACDKLTRALTENATNITSYSSYVVDSIFLILAHHCLFNLLMLLVFRVYVVQWTKLTAYQFFYCT